MQVMKNKKIIAAIVAALLVVSYLWAGGVASSKHKGKDNKPVNVVTDVAITGDIGVYVTALGNVSASQTATLRSRVDGQLKSILFKEGQVVKEGQLLAEIDPREFYAKLEQAEGQRLRNAALLAQAQQDLARYTTLFSQDSIAKQQLDNQQSLVKQYEGALRNDKGAIDAAKLQITYAKITAPFAGTLGLRQVDVGNQIKVNDANGIVVLTQLQPIDVVFSLPEDRLASVLTQIKNHVITAEAWDKENRQLLASGEVSALDNQIDSTTGTIKMRASFSNENSMLFPNQFVNVKLYLDTKKDVVIVPSAAIQYATKGSFVYVVQGDNVKMQPVAVDYQTGDRTSIKEGVAAGDVVVIDGADNLRDGSKIVATAKSAMLANPAGEAILVPSKDRHKNAHEK